MRLHRLELVAFGPFAERQQVDFDQLSQAGLFLLHGPTGAGKTSVLDAVCFALYGRVPGVRGTVNRLRSDHAPAHVAPEVSCEFSVSGRRFEVTRSPEWQRPKKRGTGTVKEHAHVVLREWVGTEWNALTNRIDEAADLLQQLIGLGAEQFTKLILLPQGDFAAFLRASAEERRPMLQKLFGTDRFAEVERWLADRRREGEHQVQAANAITARLFARAQEARLPTGTDDVVDGVSPESAAELVADWAVQARSARSQALRQAKAAEQDYENARTRAEVAAETRDRRHRHAELRAQLAALLAGRTEQEQRRTTVTAAGHARVLAPLLTELSAAERRQAAAIQTMTQVRNEADAAGVDPDSGDENRVSELRAELGTLTEALAAERDLGRLQRQARATELELDTAEDELRAGRAETAELTDRQAQLDGERAAAELISVTRPDREQAVTRATALARAVLEHQQLVEEQAVVEDELRTAIDRHQLAVDAAQELRARRLDGMAAELAGGLADHDPCPVCGAPEHPAPARHEVPPVTDTDQRRAETALKTTETQREAALAVVQAGRQQLAALLAVTGGATAETAAATLAEAQEKVAEAREAADRVEQLNTERETLSTRLSRAADQQAAAASAAATARETLAGITARRTDLQDRLELARGDDPDVTARHRRLSREVDVLTGCAAAVQTLDESRTRVEQAQAVLEQAVAEAGFESRAAARAATRPDAEVEQLAEAVAEHDRQTTRLQALLDPEPAASEPIVDPVLDLDSVLELDGEVEQLRAAQAEARQVHEQAREQHTLAGRAVRALTGLAADLAAHATETAPLRKHFATLEAVSRCVEGTGGDNALRMRLSSYVLAARLEQVADAASVRLAAMSGGRYLLAHTDGPSRAGARSGLGLAVIDGWTGVQRDPSSLSGGETFCTSLALALGLADVVQAEAGGSAIETLLVDEGFGSLDEETLDEVMDVLDGLRSAGRSVGLVSHVPDLRDRIPAQLQVVKGRAGSRLIA